MILRFQSRDGQFRITVESDDFFSSIAQTLLEKLPQNVIPESIVVGTSPSDSDAQPLGDLAKVTFAQKNLKNGSRLYLDYRVSDNASTLAQKAATASQTTSSSVPASASQRTASASVTQKPQQSALDDRLDKKNGTIKRSYDAKMCKHNYTGMCEYCMPLEPYDAGYLAENKIKHLSFHSYLRKISSSKNKPENGSSFITPLSEPDYKVKPNCPTGHPPWPEGICSKCLPSAISLQPQEYRMVDHVEFSSPAIIETFLTAWREQGRQRIGIMYGRFDEYDEVPLGIKAVVEAIYEPPQVGEDDGLTLGEWASRSQIDEVASMCGLEPVGVIFTDLTDSGKGDGSVVCRRHADSYFLSSLEVVFAARLQSQYPKMCKWSDSGRFGSNFVTCVISGDESGNITISPYQASNAAVGLVEADLVEPCADPSMMLVRHEEDQPGGRRVRYVPDVSYRRKNQYGINVRENAKPAFPVDYLLVTLTHGFPNESNPMFLKSSFPIENRGPQEITAVSRYISENGLALNERDGSVLMSDFHLLCYLRNLEILSKDEFSLLCRLASKHSLSDADTLHQSPGWATLVQIVRSSGERFSNKRNLDMRESDRVVLASPPPSVSPYPSATMDVDHHHRAGKRNRR